MSKRLIIVRAGSQSLHTGWGEGDWDLLNAYYDDSPPPEAVHIRGGKWDGIYQLFQQQPDLLERYQTIWLPDDDIETQASDIEKLFALHEHYQLELSQAALSKESYYSHFCLLQNKHFKLRYSNFVEIMMPCFSASLLRRALPLFENNPTGYMLDKIWHRLADKPLYQTAIIDAIAMCHRRAVDSGTLDKSTHHLEKIQSLLPARKQRRPLCYGGILHDGSIIKSAPRKDQLKMIRYFLYTLPRGFRQIRYQLTQKLDLDPIKL